MCNTEPDDGLPHGDQDSMIARSEGILDWYRGPGPRIVVEQFSDLFSEVIACGRGGMGFVYRCRCRKTGESLALKLLDPEAAVDEEARRRFLREATALKRLSHKHIVGIRDSGRRGSFHYIVMDFAEGETLRDRLRGATLPQTQALHVALQIAEALRHAHSKGVIHRDLKPENVRIDAANDVNLVDFGIARILDPAAHITPLTADGEALGTGCYMAPEQRAGQTVDQRADIFALGVVLYEMLTGVKPEGKFELASHFMPEIDESVDALLDKAMSRDREKRQKDAAELCSELQHAIDNIEACEPWKQPSRAARLWAACRQPCAVGAALVTTTAAVWDACDTWTYRLLPAVSAGTRLGTISGFEITGAWVVLLLAVVIAWIAALRSGDSSMMGRLQTRGPHDPARRFRSQLQSLREQLAAVLRQLDTELDWTDALRAPIEAEVEVSHNGRPQRKLRDVDSALRAERRRRVLLLIGDAGGGKSVTLRHLTIKLLRDPCEIRTGRIPVYVDLKGWKRAEPWTRKDPPTVQQLKDFVRHCVVGSLTPETAQFVERHFEQFLAQGRFFFLVDSFDEIPAIQDVAPESWLVTALSNVVWNFLTGAHQSRGVVASRPFRQPEFSSADPDLVNLRLREFDDWRIHEALMRSPKVTEQKARSLFTDHPNLVSLARTPMYTSLIREQLEGKDPLPATLQEVFQRHIQGRLNQCDDHFGATGLTPDDVWDTATEIAWLMFSDPQELGTRVPLAELERRLPALPVRAVATVLKDARLVRLAQGRTEEFSFIHRRFQEFFLARRLLADPEQLEFDCIAQNSGYRDALVLVAEVADERTARRIAEFCWEKIKAADEAEAKPGDLAYADALHCLRFLSDAFSARHDCLTTFQTGLEFYILDRIALKEDELAAKHAVEAAGLCTPALLPVVVGSALVDPSEWIKETAFGACRRLPRPSRQDEFTLKEYLAKMPLDEFLRRRKDLHFSLSLSAAFSGVRAFCSWRTVSTWLGISASVALFFFAPVLAAVALIVAVLGTLAGSGIERLIAAGDEGRFPWTTRLLGEFQSFGTFGLLYWLLVMALVCHFPTRDAYLHFLSEHPETYPTPQVVEGALRDYDQFRGYSVPSLLTPLFAELPPPYGQPWDGFLVGTALLLLVAFRPFHRWMLRVERLPAGLRRIRSRGLEARQRFRDSPRDFVLSATATIVAWCLVVGILIGLNSRNPTAAFVAKLAATVLGVIAAVAVLVGVSWWISRRLVPALGHIRKGRMLLREATCRNVVTRNAVESVLDELRIEALQVRYLTWVQESGIVPQDSWTSGRPRCGGARANTLLAQLDESWLGLGRYQHPEPYCCRPMAASAAAGGGRAATGSGSTGAAS